jgi:hypothetical protein
MSDRERAEFMLAVRITATDLERLDAIVATSPGLLTRHSLARAAMRVGLDAIGKDPAVLFSHPIPKRGGARVRSAKAPKGERKR